MYSASAAPGGTYGAEGTAFSLEKTVLITGASRGIGAETARLFAQRGWRVAIGYHESEERALCLVRELTALGAQATAVCADVADPAQVRRLVSLTEARLGPVDALVNNAGISQQKLFCDITEEDWRRMFDVNVSGVFHCAQAVARGMIDRHCGSIVNISSIWGLAGASCEVHYSAAKAAVIGFTKALAKELALSGIRVNCVAPGVVETEMNAFLGKETLETLRQETPLQTLGTCADIAHAIYFLASDEAAFITGQVLSPNGGIVI